MAQVAKPDRKVITGIGVAFGQVGLIACPGLPEGGDRACAGALAADLYEIRDWGAEVVVSLVEQDEFERLGLAHLPEAIRSAGLSWHHFPIPDMGTPDEAGMLAWRALSPELHQRLESGGRVLFHCRAGLGRSGLMAAMMLVERGCPVEAAIGRVRAGRPGTIETTGQELWLHRRGSYRSQWAKRVHASLLAGAVGDSLGAPVEFMTLAQIRRLYPEGLSELAVQDGVSGAVTDETQMVLFTAEGLLRAHVGMRLNGTVHMSAVVHHALLRWLVTQGGKPGLPDRRICQRGLVSDPRLHAIRAPSEGTMATLARAGAFGESAHNDSKGRGSIARVAPIAFAVPRDQVADVACEISALTHGHCTGQLAAAAWAELLAEVSHGAALEPCVRRMVASYQALAAGDEVAAAMQAALAAPRDGTPETVQSLGGGWLAEEVLAIAIYASLCAEGFEHGLRIAVTHGGNSDSTGAVTGNVLGLLFCDEVLGHRWSMQVQCADVIGRIARDLAGMRTWLPHVVEVQRGFYPGR